MLPLEMKSVGRRTRRGIGGETVVTISMILLGKLIHITSVQRSKIQHILYSCRSKDLKHFDRAINYDGIKFYYVQYFLNLNGLK